MKRKLNRKWVIEEIDSSGWVIGHVYDARTKRRASAIAEERTRKFIDGHVLIFIVYDTRKNHYKRKIFYNSPLSPLEMYLNYKHGYRIKGCSKNEFLIWKLSQ